MARHHLCGAGILGSLCAETPLSFLGRPLLICSSLLTVLFEILSISKGATNTFGISSWARHWRTLSLEGSDRTGPLLETQVEVVFVFRRSSGEKALLVCCCFVWDTLARNKHAFKWSYSFSRNHFYRINNQIMMIKSESKLQLSNFAFLFNAHDN